MQDIADTPATSIDGLLDFSTMDASIAIVKHLTVEQLEEILQSNTLPGPVQRPSEYDTCPEKLGACIQLQWSDNEVDRLLFSLHKDEGTLAKNSAITDMAQWTDNELANALVDFQPDAMMHQWTDDELANALVDLQPSDAMMHQSTDTEIAETLSTCLHAAAPFLDKMQQWTDTDIVQTIATCVQAGAPAVDEQSDVQITWAGTTEDAKRRAFFLEYLAISDRVFTCISPKI